MSANPACERRILQRKNLNLPDFRDYAVEVTERGTTLSTRTRGHSGNYLRDVMKNNPTSFRVFGPDETAWDPPAGAL